MKKITTLIVMLVLCAASLFAQAPEKFTYQAVVRNANNTLVANAQVGVRVNILQGTATGSAVYSETHMVSSNANGLLTLNIGAGSVLHGSFANIDWADGPYFLKTDIDPNGGNDYNITSTQQLLSVPYALYAKEAANSFSGDYNDLTNTPQIPTVPTNVSAFTNDAGYITSYTETDPVFNAWDKNYNDLTNRPQIPTIPSNVSSFTNDAGYITATQVPSAQVNADWTAVSGAARILNKPTLFSGNYSDLVGKPTNLSQFNNDLGLATVATSGSYNDLNYRPNLATVATTGNYNDLINRPTIPTVPTNVSAFTNDAGYVTNIIEQQELSLSNDTIFLTGGSFVKLPSSSSNFSGDYNDLSNRPYIPTVPANVSAFNNDAGYITGYIETDPLFNAWNKDYNDLINRPQIPQIPAGVSAFTNDVGYITQDQVPAQVNADWNATGGVARILNKPIIPTVPTNVSAFTNDAGYLTAANVQEAANIPTNVSAFTNDAGYLTNYTETDPQFNAWDKNYNDLTNKPTLFDGNYNSLDNRPNLATVATSGNYNDLANRPAIPTVPSNVSVFNNDAHYITEGQYNVWVNAVNNVIDSLRNRIEELETNSPGNEMVLATVNTVSVLNITGTTAQSGGNITSDGGSPVSVRGICWNTSHNPTVNNNYTNDGSGIGSYVSVLTSLNSGTTYYVRAYAINGVGISYGNEVSFTPPVPFACGTSTVADFDGNNYQTVQLGEQCWMKENLRTAHYSTGEAITQGTTAQSSTSIRYYYNSGNQGFFYNWPAVMGPENVSANNQGVCPSGWHVPDVGDWQQLCQYVGTQSQYVCDNNSSSVAKALTSKMGWFSASDQCAPGNNPSSNNLTGFNAFPSGILSSGSYYYHGEEACFWSTNETNSSSSRSPYFSYSSSSLHTADQSKKSGLPVRCLRDEGFSTSLPIVSTVAVASATTATATSGGYISYGGGSAVTARGICWSTSHSPTVNDNYTVDGVGTGSFTSNLTSLTAGTTYYVRAYAINGVGVGYGNEVSFTTQAPAIPTITTTAVSSITTTTAITGGNVTNSGGSSVTARGVCWSVLHNPTISGNHTDNGTGLGYFTSNITNLTAGTTYYVRAYAINDEGVAYGNEVSFTTQQPFVCGTSTVADFDGNIYHTLQLGNQCWMKENLRSTHYSDGTLISQGSITQSSTTTRYYYNPGNSQEYGYLYNWPAAKGTSNVSANNQGVCPSGWHLPSDAEWTQLTQYMGDQSQFCCSNNSLYVAKALASTSGWESDSYYCSVGYAQNSNNATGFSAVPAGYFCIRTPNISGGFYEIGENAGFWSCTASNSTDAYGMELYYDDAFVTRDTWAKSVGSSVRCLRD